MEAKVIVAESASKVSKEGTSIWTVFVSGEENRMFCKNAYKAMRFAFLLKKRTGLAISENCLKRLSQEIQQEKEAKAAAVKEAIEVIAEEKSVDKVLQEQPKKEAPEALQLSQPEAKPKKQRKPRAKKAKVVDFV